MVKTNNDNNDSAYSAIMKTSRKGDKEEKRGRAKSQTEPTDTSRVRSKSRTRGGAGTKKRTVPKEAPHLSPVRRQGGKKSRKWADEDDEGEALDEGTGTGERRRKQNPFGVMESDCEEGSDAKGKSTAEEESSDDEGGSDDMDVSSDEDDDSDEDEVQIVEPVGDPVAAQEEARIARYEAPSIRAVVASPEFKKHLQNSRSAL